MVASQWLATGVGKNSRQRRPGNVSFAAFLVWQFGKRLASCIPSTDYSNFLELPSRVQFAWGQEHSAVASWCSCDIRCCCVLSPLTLQCWVQKALPECMFLHSVSKFCTKKS